ncbi:hypothetical protein E4U55_006041 [Claviceps digitariae]|nr:hypothetical protein E4U55_006041 [Claviceps digitariae]
MPGRASRYLGLKRRLFDPLRSATQLAETQLASSPETSHSNVFLKLENLQPSESFKSRGIGHFLVSQLARVQQAAPPDQEQPPRPHFYCSSGGNAGLACVHGAVTLGCEATIVVPLSTTPFMIAKLREAGAKDVVQRGASWQEADDYLTGTLMAEARARGDAAIYVHPFDASEVWDGNAPIIREIVRQWPDMKRHYPMNRSRNTNTVVDKRDNDIPDAGPPDIDAIVCSVGGGGLFCGIMQGIDEHDMKHTKVIAMETHGADSSPSPLPTASTSPCQPSRAWPPVSGRAKSAVAHSSTR